MEAPLEQKFSDFYLSTSNSYASVKRSRNVKAHTSQRRITSLPSTEVREFRANFPVLAASLLREFLRSHSKRKFVESIKECFSHGKLNIE